MAPSDAAWERLGELLTQRRAQLDPRYGRRTVFARERHLDYRIVYEVERHRRHNFGDGMLAAIEAAYALVPGSLKRTLDGAPLEAAADGNAAPSSPANGQAFPSADEARIPADVAAAMQDTALTSIMPGIRARAKAILARNPQATGRDIFPGETLAPQFWDVSRTSGVFSFDECVLQAAAGHLEEERRKWRDQRSG